MRSIFIIISYLLASIQTAQADDKDKTLFAATSQATPQWQQLRAGVQSDDYQRITHNNQQVVLHSLGSWSKQVLAKYDTYAPALTMLGATLDVALRDRRYGLNDSGSMGLMVRDSASNNRALMLEYRTSW